MTSIHSWSKTHVTETYSWIWLSVYKKSLIIKSTASKKSKIKTVGFWLSHCCIGLNLLCVQYCCITPVWPSCRNHLCVQKYLFLLWCDCMNVQDTNANLIITPPRVYPTYAFVLPGDSSFQPVKAQKAHQWVQSFLGWTYSSYSPARATLNR